MVRGGMGGGGIGFSISFGPGGFMTMTSGGGGYLHPVHSSSASSNCGADFDDYVQQALEAPFPYSPVSPASLVRADLWKNRRLRLCNITGNDDNEYCEGKVVSWRQWNTGPFSSTTHWEISVQLDSLDPHSSGLGKGDTVVVHEIPKAHHGKHGKIVQCLKDKKYKILLEEQLQFITVKEEHLKPATISFAVHRMNIDGGGIVMHLPPEEEEAETDRTQRRIALEWIDPASPTIDIIHRNIVSASCPTCRAVEPPMMAYDDDSLTTTTSPQACPVCTCTNKPSRTLQCHHQFCTDCWKQWRDSAGSKIPSELSAPDISRDKLQQERDQNFQKMQALLPHTMGGTATSPETSRKCRSTARSNDTAIDDAVEKFRLRVGSILHELDEYMEQDDDEGLAQFWEKLLTVSIHILGKQDIMQELVRDLYSIAALEILMRVTEDRAPEIVASWQVLKEIENSSEDSAEGYVQFLNTIYCSRIGELYKRVKKYRSAIHWYERAVLYAKKEMKLELDAGNNSNSHHRQEQLAYRYTVLASAQKRAGLLSKALENYDAGMEQFAHEDLVHHKMCLVEEMDHWTGSSGKLTPGC